jgi:hypothetical protein
MTEQAPTLAEALVIALGQMTDVVRAGSADAGSYKYRYVELADVLAMARPVLALHGLALCCIVSDDEAHIIVSAWFRHAGGEEMYAGQLRLDRGSTIQATGSAITYARRYLTMSALGIAGDDDDGQATQEPPAPSPERARAIDLFERVKALDPAQREAFNLWRQAHPSPAVSVNAMTKDSEWAMTVASALMDLET